MKTIKKITVIAAGLLSLYSAVAFAQTTVNGNNNLTIVLPPPPQAFQYQLPAPPPLTTIVDIIRNFFIPPVCPVPLPQCNVSLKDVSDPSNNFTLSAVCTGGLAPCTLYETKSPPKPISVFQGNFTANLNLDEIGAPAVTYTIKDKHNQVCNWVIAHAFVPGTPPPGQSIALDESGYRFFANADSVTPGSPLAGLNTAPSMVKNSTFRARILVQVTNQALALNGQSFKLQFGTKVSTCSAIGSWTDVASGSGAIRYNNNATPADGDPLGVTANDPTHDTDTIVNQTYEEANNFINSQGAVPAGQDGHWDFSLTHFFSGTSFSNTTYCLRIVKADGTTLDSYSQYPELNVTN